MPCLLWSVLLLTAPGPWRSYEVYQPSITQHFVCNTHTQPLKYNHDSSVAWFKGRWICVWNANEPAAEGKPGQLNYQSTSADGITWSAAEPAFAAPEHSTNPVPCPKGTQWQPNLLVVGEQLWAVWSQSSRDEFNGTYVSRLDEPGGQWTNQRILFGDQPDPELDGERWRIFATQNPIRLNSGRVLAPVTISSSQPAADAPEGVTSWWAREKRNTVLYSDDLGQTWHCSPGAIQPGRSWAQWEPTVWELPDGTVRMVARNNDFRGRPEDGPRPAEMLLQSTSTDGGRTWTPHTYVPLETVASRMHVIPLEGRYVMVHNDHPADKFVADRLNLALFFTRGTGFDFVAGPGVTAREPTVAYPQMGVHGDRLLISYSQGRAYRSIKVADISPLPQPDRWYLFPRSNCPPSTRPELVDGALRFRGEQQAETARPVDPGPDRFTLAAKVRMTGDGTLLDTRDGAHGVLWKFNGPHPTVHLHTKEGDLESTLSLPREQWCYVGLSVDVRAGTLDFYVDDQHQHRTFATTPQTDPRGIAGSLGYKRFAASAVTGLSADVRWLAVYPKVAFTAAQHNALRHGRPVESEPVVECDPSSPAFAKSVKLPPDTAEGVWVETVDGRPSLRFRGGASAGVELDANDRATGDAVELELQFRVSAGPTVVCTVGDANEPARVLVDEGQAWLIAGQQRQALGPVKLGTWRALSLRSARELTSARLDGGATAEVTHRPVATWLYLGQGYRDGTGSPKAELALATGAVRTRVIRP